jgi:hypothetical protein
MSNFSGLKRRRISGQDDIDFNGGASSDKLNSADEYGSGATMTLTLRSRGAHLIVTGPAFSGVAKFKTRRQARDWCATHYPYLSIHEAGAEIVKRSKKTRKFGSLR